MIALIRDRNVMNVGYEVESPSQLSHIFLRSQARSDVFTQVAFKDYADTTRAIANACAVPAMARRAHWG